MLKQLRHQFVNHLWQQYRQVSTQIGQIEANLKLKKIETPVLDHFAIIDLPGPHSSMMHLCQIFSALGYCEQGRDYLPDKQNDFLWLTEQDSHELAARDVLPQVVVADFRLAEMPPAVRKIIEYYAARTQPSPLPTIQKLAERLCRDDVEVANKLFSILKNYFSGREWPLPTKKEFLAVHEFNELLAWVLVFGRRPNHFTLSIHLLNYFSDLQAFNTYIENDLHLMLNRDGGEIKGGRAVGIAQSSTKGLPRMVKLADGEVELPGEFVEFVWRYPNDVAKNNPTRWSDFFTGFVAQNANHVIESLYSDQC